MLLDFVEDARQAALRGERPWTEPERRAAIEAAPLKGPASPGIAIWGELLDAPEQGIELTSSYAMTPGASVSGIYLGHPQSRYFSLGKIALDQVEDYAKRKGMSVREIERWLAPNLGYEDEDAAGAAA